MQLVAPAHEAGIHVPSFRLPVAGRVLVATSGADPVDNHHVHPAVANQRHAHDLVGIDEAGRMYRGSGGHVEDWIGWGMPVVAAADGVVIAAQDGVRDLAIGEGRPTDMHPAGNRVALRHDDGSVTWYVHLRLGSVRDELLGARIVAGTELGRIGNSGESNAPHLHVQRQLGPDAPGVPSPNSRGLELPTSGHRSIGRYAFGVQTGFTAWEPAPREVTTPTVLRRGEVVEPLG